MAQRGKYSSTFSLIAARRQTHSLAIGADCSVRGRLEGLVPRGPKGEKRPADVIGAAVKVMRITTGEEDDERETTAQLGKLSGAARARKLTAEQRAEIVRKGAAGR